MKAKQWIWNAVVAHALLTAACQKEEAETPSHEAQHETTSANTGCQPVEELAGFDHRKPVPLQPMMAWHQKQNMMEHLEAIQRITDGLSRDDWEEVASASSLIETSPQMQQMCQHMGAGAEGFTEMALDFHHRADAIGVAAHSHDHVAVLNAVSHTLAACTKCHAMFRQEVVSAASWQARTGQVHDPAAMHGEH